MPRIFEKSSIPRLDPEISAAILMEVFEEARVEPNNISLEVLDSYSCYRKERFVLQRFILLAVMLLFILLPILFLSSTVSVHEINETSAIFPTYQIRVKSLIPVASVTAVIDDTNIPVAENTSDSYIIKPSVNGNMKVTVTLKNRQRTTEYIDVKTIDSKTPTLVKNTQDHEHIYLYVADSDSGINYANIRAIDSDNNRISPLSYDEATGEIIFSYPKKDVNVFIPDYAGNTLTLKLSLD